LKEIHPEFADDVAFYLIGADPNERLEKLVAYRDENNYPWPIAFPGIGTLRKLWVVSQATKIALNKEGIITYRDGYGRGSDQTWRGVFEDLAAQ